MKKALLLCATHNDLGLIAALRKLGYYIVSSGNRAGLPGERLVDKYIPGDYSDKEAMLALARAEKIEAVCACCNDFGVYTAAYIAEQMGLPGYDTYENVLNIHNKDRFKAVIDALKIPTPESKMFDSVQAALEYVNKVRFPIMIKPVDCSAGNGISRCETAEAATLAIEKAFMASSAKRIVIERFACGSQHGLCTFLIDRKVVAYCSNNEYSLLNPFRVEIDTFPSDSDLATKKELIGYIERIADALQLKDGIFHIQYIMDEGRPLIIEAMRRILGNMYHVPGNRLTGIDWEYWYVRAKCGLPLDAFPSQVFEEGCFAYKTILAPQNGTIASISIPLEYQRYLADKFMLKQPGDKVTRFQSEPIGFLFFAFADKAQMQEMLIDNYRNDLVEIV